MTVLSPRNPAIGLRGRTNHLIRYKPDRPGQSQCFSCDLLRARPIGAVGQICKNLVHE